MIYHNPLLPRCVDCPSTPVCLCSDNEQCVLVSALTARVDLEDDEVIRDFGAGAMPEVEQASPCTMRLTVTGHVQTVVFPFPITGSQKKVRLARKSRYIEVRTYECLYQHLFMTYM